MAIGPLPPWLDMTPALYQRAIESGAQVGVQLARQNQEAQQRALDRAAREASETQRQQFLAEEGEANRDLRRELGQMSLAERRAALGQRAEEFGASLDIRKAANEIARQRASDLGDYRNYRLEQLDRALELQEDKNSPEAIAAKADAAQTARRIKMRDTYRANAAGAIKALTALKKNPVANPNLVDKYTSDAERFAAMADAIDEQLAPSGQAGAAAAPAGAVVATPGAVTGASTNAAGVKKVWRYGKDGTLQLITK